MNEKVELHELFVDHLHASRRLQDNTQMLIGELKSRREADEETISDLRKQCMSLERQIRSFANERAEIMEGADKRNREEHQAHERVVQHLRDQLEEEQLRNATLRGQVEIYESLFEKGGKWSGK